MLGSRPSLGLLGFGLGLLLLLDLGPALLLRSHDPSAGFLAHMAFGLFLFGWFVGLGWTTATAAWLAGYGLWGLSAKHGSEFGLQFLNLFGHLNGTLQVLKGRGNHGSASFVMRRTAAGKGNLSRAEADSPLAPVFLA